VVSQEMKHFPMKRSEPFYGYCIVWVAFFIMFVFWGAFYAFGVFFKPMLKEFGWTRAMTAGAFSLCSMIQGLPGIAMGGLTDKFGPRVVITLCGLPLGLGYALMSQVSAMWQLYLLYYTWQHCLRGRCSLRPVDKA
jgi:sugar phosphate permease